MSAEHFRVAIGSDHRGAKAAKIVRETLDTLGHEARIVDSCEDTPCDYPEKAWSVALEIEQGRADRGVLICGTGIGMSIAANKIKGLRAALVHDELTAQLSRSHNDANVLCISADLLGAPLIEKIVAAWMGTGFDGGRHARRLAKIGAIEQGHDPTRVTAAS